MRQNKIIEKTFLRLSVLAFLFSVFFPALLLFNSAPQQKSKSSSFSFEKRTHENTPKAFFSGVCEIEENEENESDEDLHNKLPAALSSVPGYASYCNVLNSDQYTRQSSSSENHLYKRNCVFRI